MKTIHVTRFHVCQTIMIAQGLSPGWPGVFGPPEETDFCTGIAALPVDIRRLRKKTVSNPLVCLTFALKVGWLRRQEG